MQEERDKTAKDFLKMFAESPEDDTGNQTYIKEFYLVPFSVKSDYLLLIDIVFFLLYIFGFIFNSIIITVIYIDVQLHTPMYLFICNLALVDICYTSNTVPKLLYMLLSKDNTVSFIQCFTQMYFYVMVGSTEDVLIFVMAYDRYVAICHPLHYHSILNRKNCLLIASATWILGCINAFVITVPVSHMSFCHSNIIHNFYCDTKALINISCAGTEDFYIVIYLELLVLGFFPAVLSLTSYIKIIGVILQIKCNDGRKKTFSTCSSHLTTLSIYYITCLSVYMMPTSGYSNVLEPIFTVLYSVVTPMINPLIYSLRNKDVKNSLIKSLGNKLSSKQC